MVDTDTVLPACAGGSWEYRSLRPWQKRIRVPSSSKRQHIECVYCRLDGNRLVLFVATETGFGGVLLRLDLLCSGDEGNELKATPPKLPANFQFSCP